VHSYCSSFHRTVQNQTIIGQSTDMVKSNLISPLDRQIALIVAAVTMGLLIRATPFDLLPGDAGEFQFAAWNFGLAHATGYPLYLIVGGLWQHFWALFSVSPAASLNALSVVFTGLAAGGLFLLLVGWLPGAAIVRRLAAALSVAFFIANPTVRSQTIQAEVYALHALFLIVILWAAGRLTQDAKGEQDMFARRFALLALLFGLALTHHATTILLAPALLIYLVTWRRDWWRNARAWLWGLPAGLAPLLLYLYVPLRSGPDASPWYHQPLGDSVLTLFERTPAAFVDFVTGRSISVGFHDAATALAGAPTAAVLWLRHFEWAGVVLIAVGLFVLVRLRAWPLLALTVSYFVLQLIFNLFYAIGDIFVYYIPLYLIACIWIAFASAGIGAGFRLAPPEGVAEQPVGWGVGLLIVLLAFPAQLWLTYTPIFDQLKRDSAAARAQWEAILAAAPPSDAILISNDRNEIVPFFYLQTVENRAAARTALFPLIAPGDRFRDIGATVQTALDEGGAQPVYLVKPMPGLETRFTLEPRAEPLVEVMAPAVAPTPLTALDLRYGPLILAGYTWTPIAEGAEVTLVWSAAEALDGVYTTTVQIFDAAGEKLGQSDRPPGGDYYPTSLWKPGETLIDRHTIALQTGAQPARMLVGMYTGADGALLAPPLEFSIDEASQ
jgi:hypothetical protein